MQMGQSLKMAPSPLMTASSSPLAIVTIFTHSILPSKFSLVLIAS
jgi:hypothetical protein